MVANPAFDHFDPSFERSRRLELQPVDLRPAELRERLLDSLAPPWRRTRPDEDADASGR